MTDEVHDAQGSFGLIPSENGETGAPPGGGIIDGLQTLPDSLQHMSVQKVRAIISKTTKFG